MAIKKTAIPPKPSAAEKFVSGNLATASKAEPKPAKSIVQTPQIETEKTKLKRLTLDISEDLHRSIKMKSVSLGIPMVDMLRTLLESNYGNS
jgi:hypothetical protein